MNLFESLQILKESENKLVSEFKEFLVSKNAQYIANEIGETKDGMQIVIYDGDWKHEHRYMRNLINEFFENKGMNISININTKPSNQDTYTATYDIIFNAKPKEYMADVTPLKFTTEAKLPKPPKFWDSMFRVNAIKAYNDGELTLDNIEEWETKYNGGIKPNPSLGTKEILKYYIDNKDVLEEVVEVESNTSNWKQRFKGMDVYISDKYPNYQIKKSYTSSKQEVWQVLNFKTQREVFASGTFEGAVKWVENKDVSKSEALDKMEESINDSDWEFIEETTTNDEIFGDITEGGYYIKHYNDDMTGIIYPPSESEKLYRAKLTRKNKFNSFGSNAFIELDSAKEFLDTRAYELTSVTYEEIKQQLEEIDTHEYLKIFIDEPTKLGNVSVSIEGTLINGDPITFYDSSYIVNQRDIDFIKEQYAKASKEIDHMRERGYIGVKDESTVCNNTISVEYTYNGDDISDYKGHIKVCTDNEEVALNVAEKYIKNNHPEINPRNFIVSNDNYNNVDIIDIDGKKLTESNDEDCHDSAAVFLDKIEKEITDATHKFMMSKGFPEDEVKDYSRVSTDVTDDYVKIMVGAELEYDSLFELCKTLDKIIEKEDKDAYFEPECPGRIVAYLFGEKAKQVHKEKEYALKDKINSLNKVEETNHNIIEDKDYATGEEMYNELVKYLNSLDQIAMDGNDCNWEPSEFNAKNLNADGEIYLECGAYILIYPYINEWAEDYFKVIVVDADTCELSIQLKNGIEKIFNKFKTDKWKLVFEG